MISSSQSAAPADDLAPLPEGWLPLGMAKPGVIATDEWFPTAYAVDEREVEHRDTVWLVRLNAERAQHREDRAALEATGQELEQWKSVAAERLKALEQAESAADAMKLAVNEATRAAIAIRDNDVRTCNEMAERRLLAMAKLADDMISAHAHGPDRDFWKEWLAEYEPEAAQAIARGADEVPA